MMGDAQYENGSTTKVPEAVGLSSANVFANKYTPSPSQSYSVLVMVTTLLLSPHSSATRALINWKRGGETGMG